MKEGIHHTVITQGLYLDRSSFSLLTLLWNVHVRVRPIWLLLQPEKEPVLHLFGHAEVRKKKKQIKCSWKSKVGCGAVFRNPSVDIPLINGSGDWMQVSPDLQVQTLMWNASGGPIREHCHDNRLDKSICFQICQTTWFTADQSLTGNSEPYGFFYYYLFPLFFFTEFMSFLIQFVLLLYCAAVRS